MTLKKCYIENFGTLQDFTYEFESGINTIQQENGWGKTTLGVFIKAMFYGLEYSPNKRLADNERKKYLPWQGGNYGGSLEFQINEKAYRLERYFGKKDKEDIFCLYDLNTGLCSQDYTENIGEEIFRIDKGSYERSTYIPQNEIAISMTDSINAKLSNLVENGNDINNYETAYAKLEERVKEFKRRGGKGKIPELTEQIFKMQENIDECINKAQRMERVAAQIEQQKEQRKEFELRRKTLKEAILSASVAKEQAAKKGHYDSLKKRAEEIKQQKQPLDEIFAANLPDEQQMTYYEQEISALQELKQARMIAKQNEEEEDRLNELDDFFANGCPDSPEIEMYLGESRQTVIIKDEIIGINSKLEILEQQREQERARRQAEAELKSREKQAKFEAEKVRVEFMKRMFLTIGILLLALGLVLNILQQPVFYLLFVLAAVSLLIAFFIKPQKKYSFESSADDDKNQDIGESEDVENVTYPEMEELKADLVRLNSQKEEMDNHYHNFVLQFPVKEVDENPTQTLMELKSKALEYQSLHTRETERKEQNEQLNVLYGEKSAKLQAEFLKIHDKYTQCADLRRAYEELVTERKEYLRLSEEYQKSCQDIHQFEESNTGFGSEAERQREVSAEDVISLEELQEQEKQNEVQIAVRNDNISSYRKDMDAMGVVADQQADFEAELALLKNQLGEAEAQCKILEKTMQYLKEAKESFSTHYMGAMRKGFSKYASLMGQDLADCIQLNIQLEAQQAVGGSFKGKDYFSTGNRDFIGICIRLALVEALFEDEKPFIILDDPFVNLDDGKVENAKKILKKIAERYQIIYLVCHTSRSVS